MLKKLDTHIYLDNSYFFDLNEVYQGCEIVVQRLVNYPVYCQLHSEESRSLSQEALEKLYEVGMQTEKVYLEKGNYIINNDFFYGDFEIGNHGYLDGDCELRSKYDESVFNLSFKCGKVIEGEVLDGESVVSRMSSKDSIFTVERFSDEVLVAKQEVDLRLETDKNTVFYTYYDNGSLESIENNILQKDTFYYRNGNIQKEKDLLNERVLYYTKQGNLSEEFYNDQGYKCCITYDAGAVKSKTCMGEEEVYHYFYKDDALDYYEVTNKATQQVVKYYKNELKEQLEMHQQLSFIS